MGGGGGDGDGERACFEDLGLAPREAGGEPSCFGFESGLFVSLEEASPESLSVAADFGLEAAAEEKVMRRRGGLSWCRGIYHFGLEKGSQALEVCLSNCFLPLRSTSVAFDGERRWRGAGGAGGGEGRKVAQ